MSILQSLEPRHLLAANSFLDDDILTILGTPQIDWIDVSQSSDSVIVENRITNEIATFSSDDISEILFHGGDGDDEFANRTFLPSRIYGGDGDDLLIGGWRNDFLDGESGDDRLYGNSGDDSLIGGLGNDYLLGYSGNDKLYGKSGHDVLNGGIGDDHLSGYLGNDLLLGSDGDDDLYGHDGDDQLYGGDGDDLINAGSGNDFLSGYAGDDRLYGKSGDDVLNGGSGDDHLSGYLGNDLLIGYTGDDTLLGHDGDDRLFGGDGDDIIEGGNGNDYLSGLSGHDKLYGKAGDDVIYGGSGDDYLSGLTGDDLLYGNDGNDTLDGKDGDDRIYGNDGNDILKGGDGADSLYGGDGDDRLDGGLTNQTSVFQFSQPRIRQYLEGGDGRDTIRTLTEADRVRGGNGIDLLRVGPQSALRDARPNGFIQQVDEDLLVDDGLAVFRQSGIPSKAFSLANRVGIKIDRYANTTDFRVASGASLMSQFSELPLDDEKLYYVAEFDPSQSISVGPASVGQYVEPSILIYNEADESLFVRFRNEKRVLISVGVSNKSQIPFRPNSPITNYPQEAFRGHLYAFADGVRIGGTPLKAGGSFVLDLDRSNNDAVPPLYRAAAFWDALLADEKDVRLHEWVIQVNGTDIFDATLGVNGTLSFSETLESVLRIEGQTLNLTLPLGKGAAIVDGGTLSFRAETEDPFQDLGLPGQPSFNSFLDDLPFLNPSNASAKGFVDGVITELGVHAKVNLSGELNQAGVLSQFTIDNQYLRLRGEVDVLGSDIGFTTTVNFQSMKSTVQADWKLLRGVDSIRISVREDQIDFHGNDPRMTVSARWPSLSYNLTPPSISNISFGELDNAVESVVDRLIDQIPGLAPIFRLAEGGVREGIRGAKLMMQAIPEIGSTNRDLSWARATGMTAGRWTVRSDGNTFEPIWVPYQIADVHKWVSEGAGQNLRAGLHVAFRDGHVGWGSSIDDAEDAVSDFIGGIQNPICRFIC